MTLRNDRRRDRTALRQEEIPPQDVVVLSSHGFDNSEIAHSLPGRYQLVESANELGEYDPLLVDPRLQGARVEGRDPLRARGPRRREPDAAALRGDLARDQSLRGRGAEAVACQIRVRRPTSCE